MITIQAMVNLASRFLEILKHWRSELRKKRSKDFGNEMIGLSKGNGAELKTQNSELRSRSFGLRVEAERPINVLRHLHVTLSPTKG